MKTLLREKSLAEKIGVSPRTLRAWRVLRIIPFIKVRKVILFDEADVLAALGKFERKSK